jgi:hypothetical protein
VIPDHPELNVTAEFLGEEGIAINFGGETTTFLPTMTGQVSSPEPYQPATVSINLLKTQFLADLYKAQIEDDARIGGVFVRVDTRQLGVYNFSNCAIQNIGEIRANGKDAGFRVTIQGYYTINNALWDE